MFLFFTEMNYKWKNVNHLFFDLDHRIPLKRSYNGNFDEFKNGANNEKKTFSRFKTEFLWLNNLNMIYQHISIHTYIYKIFKKGTQQLLVSKHSFSDSSGSKC